VRVEVIGIANSRKMLSANPASARGMESPVEAEGESTDLAAFVGQGAGAQPAQRGLVDCTRATRCRNCTSAPARLDRSRHAQQEGQYRESGFLLRPHRAVRESGSRYLYETTAGAGLPVSPPCTTSSSRANRIVRIEAMLSGTIGTSCQLWTARLPREPRAQGQEPANTEPTPAKTYARNAARQGPDPRPRVRARARSSPTCDRAPPPRLLHNAPGIDAFFAELEREDPSSGSMIADAKAPSSSRRRQSTRRAYGWASERRLKAITFRSPRRGECRGLHDRALCDAALSSSAALGAGGEVTAGGLFATSCASPNRLYEGRDSAYARRRSLTEFRARKSLFRDQTALGSGQYRDPTDRVRTQSPARTGPLASFSSLIAEDRESSKSNAAAIAWAIWPRGMSCFRQSRQRPGKAVHGARACAGRSRPPALSCPPAYGWRNARGSSPTCSRSGPSPTPCFGGDARAELPPSRRAAGPEHGRIA